MTIHLTLLCATTVQVTNGAMAGVTLTLEPERDATVAGEPLPPYALAVRGPSARCAQAADTLGLDTTTEPLLRDVDYGSWRGRTLDEIAADDPYGLSAWLTDPEAAPHDGESVGHLCRRAARWLRSLPPDTGPALAIAPSAVIRALLVHALSAPPRAFWHVGELPLPSAVRLASQTV